MVRLCIGELERECLRTGRRAIVVTHEPSLVAPANATELAGIWLFQVDRPPVSMGTLFTEAQAPRVTASLIQNPQLVSQLVFSPRPVFVEGILDVAAISTSLRRTQPPEVVAQTDLIDCTGSGTVALWFTIAKKAGLDFRAVGDLDCILDRDVQSFLDTQPEISQRYQQELFQEPANTSSVVRPLYEAMRSAGIPNERCPWPELSPR
jgi:hypothetical protein